MRILCASQASWFYDGRLRAASEIAERGSFLDFECPIEWLNITSQVAEDSTEEFIGANFGRINKAEARTVVRRLRHCIESIGVEQFIEDRIDVGIISPYRMQVQLLRQMIASDSFLSRCVSLFLSIRWMVSKVKSVT